MDFTGKPLKSMVYIGPAGYRTEAQRRAGSCREWAMRSRFLRSSSFSLVWTALWPLVGGEDLFPQSNSARRDFYELVGLNELDGLF